MPELSSAPQRLERIRVALVMGLSFVLTVTGVPVAEAVLHMRESFQYNSGLSVKDRGTSGSGWAGAWSGDSQPTITSPGLTYTSGGDELIVAGNKASSGSGGSLKKAERTISNTNLDNNGTSLWMSFLITGATGTAQTNVNLSEKFFVGQGNKTSGASTWTLSDDGQSGFDFNSGVTASGMTAYLVTLIEFASGNETAWLWINPSLSATPSKSSAANGLSGTVIASFEFDKIFMYFSGNNSGAIDELRFGSTFADVSPVPEPSAVLFGTLVCGVFALAIAKRQLAIRLARDAV
jgi:hypothetical protein